MFYEKWRWLFFTYLAFQGLSLLFNVWEVEQPVRRAAWLVGIGWLLLGLRFLYHRLLRTRWAYRLLRIQHPLVEKLLRPFSKPGFIERAYLRIKPPAWCRKTGDDLMLIYRDQNKLLFEGQVVIGMLVQANERLFESGMDRAAPANVIYTTELQAENPVLRLWAIAQRLFSLKGTQPEDAAEQKMAKMVSYDLGRDFRVTVPESLAEGLDVTYTTIMVHRKHLPEGYLSNVFFPLLVHEESRAAMILPARYWSPELLSDWETDAGKD